MTPCRAHPVKGQTRCKIHLGYPLEQARHEHAARTAVATYGLPVDIDPQQAILDELARTAGHVQWLGAVVAAMDPAALVWGTTRASTPDLGARRPELSISAQAAPSVWLTLYRQEREHLAKVAKAALDAGIAERQVRLAEQQARMLAEVVRNIITDLGHDMADETVAEVVRLRLVEGSEAV